MAPPPTQMLSCGKKNPKVPCHDLCSWICYNRFNLWTSAARPLLFPWAGLHSLPSHLFYLVSPQPHSLQWSKEASVFTEVGRATVPRGPKFYRVFAISAQAIRFSKLPIKPSARSNIFNLLSLYEQRKKMHIVHSEWDRESWLASNWEAKSRFLFSLHSKSMPWIHVWRIRNNRLQLPRTSNMFHSSSRYSSEIYLWLWKTGENEALFSASICLCLWKFFNTWSNRRKCSNIINPTKLRYKLIKSSRRLISFKRERWALKKHIKTWQGIYYFILYWNKNLMLKL